MNPDKLIIRVFLRLIVTNLLGLNIYAEGFIFMLKQ